MYLVLSALTSSPISLAAATKASAFFFTVCTLPPNILTGFIIRSFSCFLSVFHLAVFA
jgi:hypothetical protein